MAKTRRRKKRTHVEDVPDPAKKREPRTFVFRRGKRSTPLADLELDLRRMMQPNTAMNLRETRRNVVKDFVQVAGPLGVSHFLILTATEKASYLRVCKTPRGPTMTLKLHSWSLMRDVVAAQVRPRLPQAAFKSPPLVLLSGFDSQQHLKLATVLFQGMFPAINVKKTKLSTCQRVVLLARDKETGLLSLRHYTISCAPSGVKKSVKALLSRRELPDMSGCADVAEFITRSGYGSESEGEDAEASRVVLGQDLGRGNTAGHTSRVRLHEVGPRVEMELLKVEEGLCDGKVLYHALIAKTPEEAAQLQARHEAAAATKEARRRQQEENVRRKEALKQAKAEAKAKAKAKKTAAAQPDEPDGGGGDRGGRPPMAGSKRPRGNAGDEDGDDDAAYFEEEVGHAPEDTDMVGRGPSSSGAPPGMRRRKHNASDGRKGGPQGGKRGFKGQPPPRRGGKAPGPGKPVHKKQRR